MPSLRSWILFLLGLGAAWMLQSRLWLPFSNPYQVDSPTTRLGYNPSNNVVRILVLAILPAALLGLACLHKKARALLLGTASPPPPPRPGRSKLGWLLLALLVVTTAGALLPFHGNPNTGLDLFHEGESLDPATALLHGQQPYRDVIIYHGMLVDPLRSVLGFQLFGRSVGAERAVTNGLFLATYAGLCLFLVALCDGCLDEVALAWCAVVGSYLYGPWETGFDIHRRDLLLYPVLWVVMRLLDEPRAGWRMAALGALTGAAFANSVDTGLYLSVVAVPYAVLLSRRQGGGWLWIGGYGLGLSLVGILIHGHFLTGLEVTAMLARMIPFFGPPLRFRTFNLVFCLVALSLCFFWVVRRVLREGQPWQQAWCGPYRREILLLALALVYFRTAMASPDLVHTNYSADPLYLLLACIFLRHYFRRLPARVRSALCILVLGLFTLYFSLMFNERQWFVFSNASDRELFPPEYVQAGDYLRSQGGTVYSMGENGSWYYLLDQPCPTRFQSPLYARSPKDQESIRQDLEQKEVEWVVNCPPSGDIPVVETYVRSHYRVVERFGQVELWRRQP